ncbi:MAG: hypothetical protein BRD30_03410, partial [Bacteroidetes bacterium QH_2_63_10]
MTQTDTHVLNSLIQTARVESAPVGRILPVGRWAVGGLLLGLFLISRAPSPAAAQDFMDSGQDLGDGHTEAVSMGDLNGDG